ncbi:MAG: hypothetical protein Q8R39_01880 [bacterium]|nr:hypothetical protein [bacterium]MDZ4284514.1 hypothetical protein [Patescibacteria group bacterium]
MQNVLIVGLSFGVVVLLVVTARAEHQRRKEVLLQKSTALESVVATTTLPSPFSSLALDARAAIVWDVALARPLYSRNADAQLPLASLTKLMTVLLAHERISPPVTLTIAPSALAPEGDNGLFPEEEWRLRDLIGYTLIVSSNDGARALAAAAGSVGGMVSGPSSESKALETFVTAMNERAIELGLTQTYFLNESGLDTSEAVSGGYGSAHDVARLLAEALHEIPAELEMTRTKALAVRSLSGVVHDAENTNEVVNRIPALIGGKTGYTDLAGGNLAIVFDAGFARPIAVVVLGSTQAGRFSDVERLVWATLEYLKVCTAEQTICI